MKYFTRKLIKPADLNARGTLFGGQLLKWIDGEAAIFAFCQANNTNLVTKAMSEVEFISPVGEGDIIEWFKTNWDNIAVNIITFDWIDLRNYEEFSLWILNKL